MSAPTFTITCEQMAYLTAAVIERDRLRVQLRDTEAKIVRMRQALTDYQTHCETASGASASKEPHQHNNPSKTDDSELTIETEGRVSGGDRATIQWERK